VNFFSKKVPIFFFLPKERIFGPQVFSTTHQQQRLKNIKAD